MLLVVTEHEVPSPEHLDEVVELVAGEIGPRWLGVDGFCGAALMLDRQRLRFLSTSYWASREHFAAYQERWDTTSRVAAAFAHATQLRVEAWDVAASGGTGSPSLGEDAQIARW